MFISKLIVMGTNEICYKNNFILATYLYEKSLKLKGQDGIEYKVGLLT